MQFSIKNTTRQSVPKIQFEQIKNPVLSREYELSLVFVGPTTSRRLNKTYRGKDRATNVLSFPISKHSGEIFIDLSTARKELKKFNMNWSKFITYLFIHGLLHLKGMEHGDTMEKAERKLLGEVFSKSKNVTPNRSRD